MYACVCVGLMSVTAASLELSQCSMLYHLYLQQHVGGPYSPLCLGKRLNLQKHCGCKRVLRQVEFGYVFAFLCIRRSLLCSWHYPSWHVCCVSLGSVGRRVIKLHSTRYHETEHDCTKVKKVWPDFFFFGLRTIKIEEVVISHGFQSCFVGLEHALKC